MFEKGEKVGVYEIAEKLGQGGMATVYKAYHPSLDRYVALKVLHPALKDTEGFIGRFEREARLVARLDHPSIVAVYDFAEFKGNPYLVMRYIEGETLKTALARGVFNKDDVTHVITSVGEGLAYAHGQEILHRDIKPSNIMLSTDGKVFITDFGLARMAQVGESTLSRDMLIGTPQYLSPEQAKGEKIDMGSDIYSFGVVIYELLVGQVPYNADTPYAIIHDHIFTPLPMPRDLNPKVTPDVEAFLLKALAKKRDDRFQSIREMVDAYKVAVGDAPAPAAAAPAAKPTRSDPSPPKRGRPATVPVPTPVPAPRQVEVPAPRPEIQVPDPTSSAPRGGRQRSKRSGAWAVVGIVLLIALLIAGGLMIGTVVSEELNFVFGQAESSYMLHWLASYL